MRATCRAALRATLGQPLRILAVDDDQLALRMLTAMLHSKGHDAIPARNGQEAIERFERDAPDLVLIDVSMPVMDGYEATAEIKKRCGNRWVPVIFLSSASEAEQQVRGLEVGGDDYLIKPVNPTILEAKLRAMRRIVDIQRTVLQQSEELARYRDEWESEQALASHVMDRLVAVHQLASDQVRSVCIPARRFSGDVTAVARGPRGELHLMLADSTGHGLGAALTVIPVVQAFYDLVGQGFVLSGIVRRLNQQVRRLLPRERFVATTLVAVDETQRTIEIWNGANPTAVFVEDTGALVRFPPRHPALGVLDDAAFDATTEMHGWRLGGEFLMWSDGCNEAENADGQVLGDRCERIIAGATGRRFPHLLDAVNTHLRGKDPGDDVSIVSVTCATRGPDDPVPTRSAAPDTDAVPVPRWRFGLRAGAEELRVIDPVPVVLNWLDQLGLEERPRSELTVVLAELVSNAIDHGVLRLDSALKETAEGFAAYLDQRADRLAALEHAAIEVELEAEHLDGNAYIHIWVRDSGEGFDASGLVGAERALAGVRRSGRGIALVRRLCEAVEFLGAGNSVRARYRLG